MPAAPIVLIAEDDEGHAILIRQTLRDAGLGNQVMMLLQVPAVNGDQ